MSVSAACTKEDVGVRLWLCVCDVAVACTSVVVSTKVVERDEKVTKRCIWTKAHGSKRDLRTCYRATVCL